VPPLPTPPPSTSRQESALLSRAADILKRGNDGASDADDSDDDDSDSSSDGDDEGDEGDEADAPASGSGLTMQLRIAQAMRHWSATTTSVSSNSIDDVLRLSSNGTPASIGIDSVLRTGTFGSSTRLESLIGRSPGWEDLRTRAESIHLARCELDESSSEVSD
jgi:hypothetical protein